MNGYHLFVYGTLMDGECNANLLEGSERVGPARTAPVHTLVDLGVRAALVSGGTTSVLGELYVIDLATRTRLDRAHEVPILYQRVRVTVVDATEAQLDADAYVMSSDQVRGRRRIHHGDWRKRFLPAASNRPASGWSLWAHSRRRSSKT